MVSGTLAPHAEAGARQPAGQRHADAVGEALPERPRRHLDAGRLAELGVAGCLRAELAEAHDLVERKLVAEEVEQRVEQHRRVAVREHEAVAQRPLRIAGVEAQVPVPQLEGRPREAHRRARVTGVRLLDRVDGEEADGVLDALAQFGRRLAGHRHSRLPLIGAKYIPAPACLAASISVERASWSGWWDSNPRR